MFHLVSDAPATRLVLADGNVGSGQAVIQKLPVTALSSAPAETAVTWTHLQTDHYTFKSARTLTDGSVIGLCWSEVGGSARQATLVYLSSTGSVIWGPNLFGAIHGEGTSVRELTRRAEPNIGSCSPHACPLDP